MRTHVCRGIPGSTPMVPSSRNGNLRWLIMLRSFSSSKTAYEGRQEGRIPHLHILGCRKGSFMCSKHRMYHTEPQLYFLSTKASPEISASPRETIDFNRDPTRSHTFKGNFLMECTISPAGQITISIQQISIGTSPLRPPTAFSPSIVEPRSLSSRTSQTQCKSTLRAFLAV